MAGPEHADLAPPPAFGFGAAHLRATAPAASQPRPLHRVVIELNDTLATIKDTATYRRRMGSIFGSRE